MNYVLARSPLRISFFGGGSDLPAFCDLNEGCVLSTTIDKYVHTSVSNSFWKDQVKVCYSITEIVEDLDNLKHDILKAILSRCRNNKGLEVYVDSDVPGKGTGLGSSAAVCLSILKAFDLLRPGCYDHVNPNELAVYASRIELNYLRRLVGRQDQFSIANGGLNTMFFIGKDVDVVPLKISQEIKDSLQSRLLLFYLGYGKDSGEILADQSDNLRLNKKNIKTTQAMASIANTISHKLSYGTLDGFGEAMKENWELKKSLSNLISNTHIEDIYEDALKAGAIAAKVNGSGGGGTFLVYAYPHNHDRIRKALSSLEEIPFKFEDTGTTIVYSK